MACSSGVIKILPSPTLPVLAASAIASTALLNQIVRDGELDLGLGQEVDDILGAAIELGVAALTAEALDLGHRDALYADVRDGLADIIELEGLDDCCDQLH